MTKRKLIDVYNEYRNNKKFKIFYFFGIKIKITVSSYKDNLSEKKGFKKRKNINLAIAAIYKNEPDLIEWIEYHKLVGVERFYLYDNESNDNSKKLLKPYIDNGEVIYHYVKGRCKQLLVYQNAIYHYKNEVNWLAFIDLDEYIVPVEKNNINEILENYKDYPALGINWVMFDSNNLVERPKSLAIEAYTQIQTDTHSRENRHIKSIVNPKKVIHVPNPHYCIYKNNELAVSENFETIGKCPDFDETNAITKTHSSNIIRINHYHTKSQEDYCRKKQLGFADSNMKRPEIDEYLNFKDKKEDKIIFKYLPELKRRMGMIK